MSFHILFPAFSIGLAWWVVFLEAWWLKTRNPEIRDLVLFWTKIFAVSFGVGVVSGIVMSFQFGTNWASFSTQTGNIIGPMLTYEVLTAFFVEATFLGIMLFGWRRVGPRLHFAATFMVALGTLASTFWIMSANSWMQTPAGYQIQDGVFYPENWWAIIFNPSFPVRLAHMILAAFLTTAFIVGGISALYLLKNRFAKKAYFCFKCALVFVAITAPLQIFVGDMSGQEVADNQPAKLAALEGVWEDQEPLPWTLFAVPDSQQQRNNFAIEIPYAGSLIINHDFKSGIRGLTSFPKKDQPPVAIPFYGFRVMVLLGGLMLLISWWGLWKWRRGHLISTRYLYSWVWMLPSGFIALLAGWYVAEVGRQPWTVYGLLRTAESGSELVSSGQVLISLIVYISTYVLLFGAVIVYLTRTFKKGPQSSLVSANGQSSNASGTRQV